MDKKIFIIIGIIIAVVLIILAGVYFLGNSPSNPTVPEGIILFYGDGCSHCKIVDDFISENNVEEKVEFTHLEVFSNQDNAELLAEKAIFCNVDISQGAPVLFLWDTEKCFIGDQDIIKFFEVKIK